MLFQLWFVLSAPAEMIQVLQVVCADWIFVLVYLSSQSFVMLILSGTIVLLMGGHLTVMIKGVETFSRPL